MDFLEDSEDIIPDINEFDDDFSSDFMEYDDEFEEYETGSDDDFDDISIDYDYDESEFEEDEYEDEENQSDDEYDDENIGDDFLVDVSDLDFDDEKAGLPTVYDNKKNKKNSLVKKNNLPERRKTQLPEEYEEDEDLSGYYDYSESDFEEETGKKKHVFLKVLLILLLVLIIGGAFLTLTEPGRKIMYKIAAKFIVENVNGDSENENNDVTSQPLPTSEIDDDRVDPASELTPLPEIDGTDDVPYRHEDYVKTYLLFGIEEIDGASNTDTIMLVSVNTVDNTIKLTSILRDTYVEIPGYYSNKINAAYACGCKTGETTDERRANGAKMLVNVIENTYDVDISGYAYVNFSSFEKIIDRLGGIDIELGAKEAAYLNRTNYISNPAYRNVKEGMNHLNGNQALGYCRVRKVATLGGANNDYGRTVRQRRVISAIVTQYKNSALTDMIPILRDCLANIKTSLNEEQVSDLLYDVVENKIFTINQMRLPADELFRDSGKKGVFNGKYNVTYALVIDDYREENIKKFHKFLFLDEEEAEVPEDSAAPVA